MAPLPARSAVLSKASRPPSSLSAGLRLGPSPFVMRVAEALMRSPSQICEMPVSAPEVGSLVDSNARRFFFGLRTALRLVPRPLLACSMVPSGYRT